MTKRHEAQQQFEESNANLIVGNKAHCPISPKQLALTTSHSPYVIQTFKSGLTAEVYRVRFNGKDYTLKKKRPIPLVQNLDGQFSFLNEVQRRSDFQKLKDDPKTSQAFRCIVETVYADYRLGIILSEWIEGEPISELTPSLLSQLFSTLIESEKVGLFEWDLSSGNLLVDSNERLWLFDFGYMYPFDPLTEYNSDGITAPLFQFCERFETRFLSGWILDHDCSRHQSLTIFHHVKHAALGALENKIAWLRANHADRTIIDVTQSLKARYLLALENHDELERLFTVEMFRSNVLDIEDDLSGKSCTPTTVKRVNTVLEMIENDYPLLKEQGALHFHNKDKSKQELIESYQKKWHLVKQYQL